MSVVNELEKASKSPTIETANPETHPMDEYMRMDRMPHIWCPSCGIGVSVNCFAKALDKCGTPLDDIVVVSGIGCTGRVAGYMKVDSFHTTHGRAIPFATGIKLANPDLTVFAVGGDGDGLAIGGAHLPHIARRNVNVNYLLFDNSIYGLTKGQPSPSSQVGFKTKASPEVWALPG